MTTAPIFTAINIVRYSVIVALKALSGTAGVYWLEAPETAVRPFCVAQSQDAGGRGEPHLNALGWSGLITVKALADTLVAAETLMTAVAPAMAVLVPPGGYTMTAIYVRPVVIPPSAGVWQAAHQWEVYLERV
jgi:hypothetical protein